MNDNKRSVLVQVVRILAIVALGLLVFAGLVLGTCFLAFS